MSVERTGAAAPDHRRIWLPLQGAAEIKALLAQAWLPGHEKDLPLGEALS